MKSILMIAVLISASMTMAAPAKPYRVVGIGTNGKCSLVFENWGFGGDLDNEGARYFYADVRTSYAPSALIRVQTEPGGFREMTGASGDNQLVISMDYESVRNVTGYTFSNSSGSATCRLIQRQ